MMIIFSEHPNAERILNDSWELFQQKGYRGVSVDEICQRCNLTKPTLYYYFENKETLFVEVLVHRLRGFHEVIEGQGALAERLERIASTMFDSFSTEYSHLVRDLEHIKRPENGLRVREAFATEMFLPLTALMSAAVAAGELKGEPRFLAMVFAGMVDSFISHASDFGMDNRQLAVQVTQFFMRGAK